jgi:heat shock protein HslJ
MNRYVQFAVLFAAIVFTQTACASNAGGATGARALEFSDVRDKNWKLTEVRAGKNNVIFQRSMLEQEVPGDVFTLRFDEERVTGVACPNRYFAPYEMAEKQTIDIKPIAATLMFALFEPKQLKEGEFFTYLENTDQWNFVKGNLELRSKNNEGAEVFLVFNLAD